VPGERKRANSTATKRANSAATKRTNSAATKRAKSKRKAVELRNMGMP